MDDSPEVLLHVCCAPCVCYPARILKEEGFIISGYWYNPNIHGFGEHSKRLSTLGYYVAKNNEMNIIEEKYEPNEWFENINGYSKDSRCLGCYRLRLTRAARTASERGISNFTSTLLYSKYQNHQAVKEIGEEISRSTGVNFLYRDFTVGWKDGIQESKKLGLYRQQYCGCLFSEVERFRDAS